MRDSAATVQNHGKGQSEKAVAERFREVERFISGNERRIVELELLGEGGHLVGLIDRDPDHLEPLPAKLALSADELGHFLSTRTAPSGPEVHDHHLASPLGEGLYRTVRVGQRKR